MRKMITFLIITCTSCSNVENSQSPNQIASSDISIPFIGCENVADGSHVFLQTSTEKKHFIFVDQCHAISQEDFAKYFIPNNATIAFRTTSPTQENYIYLQNKKVFRSTKTNKKTSIEYQHVLSIGKKGKIKETFTLPDLTGVYTLGGHQTSWFFILQKPADQYKAVFCEMDGMLPPHDYISENLEKFPTKELNQFYIDAFDLSFHSDEGSGYFISTEAGYEVVFKEKESHLKEPLKLFFNKNYEGLMSVAYQ